MLSAQTSRAEWAWSEPKHTGNTIRDIKMLGYGGIGYAVGDYGMILKTTDDGTTWTKQDSGTTKHLYSVDCAELSGIYVCYAAGESHTVLRIFVDVDGWTQVAGPAADDIASISCPEYNTCHALSGTDVYTTVDTGANWTHKTINSYGLNKDIDCIDGTSKCFVAGEHGSFIKTSDGWAAFEAYDAINGISATMGSIECDDTGDKCMLLTESSSNVLVTVDAGASWTTSIAFGAESDALSCITSDISTCFISTNIGIYKSEDTGASWTQIYDPFSTDTPATKEAIDCIAGGSVCVSGGEKGNLLKTADSGATWTPLIIKQLDLLHVGCPLSSKTCYAIDAYGKLKKTSDSGGTWVYKAQDPPFNSIVFSSLSCPVDPEICFSAADYFVSDAVVATTNGGGLWGSLYTAFSGINKIVCPVDNATCYVSGSDGIIKTTDYGTSWTTIAIAGGASNIQCPSDTLHCYALNNGSFIRTSDGWATWESKSCPAVGCDILYCPAQGVCFAYDSSDVTGLYKTSDSGDSWGSYHFSDWLARNAPVSCSPGSGVCHAVGRNGMMYVSTDTGSTWSAEQSLTNMDFNAVDCRFSDFCYAVGDGGIMKEQPTPAPSGGVSITDNMEGDDTVRTQNDGVYDVDVIGAGSAKLYQIQARACSTASDCSDVKDWTVVKKDIGAASFTDNWSMPQDLWNSLRQGTNYISVKAYDEAGGVMQAGPLFYVKVNDASLPSTIATVNDGPYLDIDYSSSTEVFTANWSASQDLNSGIARYWYSIGTSQGASDTAGWTDNGTATFVVRAGLSMNAGGRYYFTVKAENGVGLISTSTFSDGVNIDTTPPYFTATVTAPVFFSDYDSRISATWDSAVDNISGIYGYMCSVGTTQGATDVADWSYEPGEYYEKYSSSYQEGQIYYVNVYAINGAGLPSGEVFSSGSVYDASPPSAVPMVNDGLSDDTDCVQAGSILSANWGQASDSVSGISSYNADVGTWPGADDVISVVLIDAATPEYRFNSIIVQPVVKYYTTITPYNGTGMWGPSVTSDGVMVCNGEAWDKMTSGSTKKLNKVFFTVDGAAGFAVGESGEILKTTDGGTTWVKKTSGTTNDLNDIVFPIDSQTGFAVGSYGKILKTTDGGETWQAKTSGVNENLYAVSFSRDALTGYAAGNWQTVLKTTDGGETWTPLATNLNNLSLNGLSSFPRSDKLFALSTIADYSFLMQSDDGGSQWTTKNTGYTNMIFYTHVFPKGPDIGYLGGKNGTFLRTTDGGGTWALSESGFDSTIRSMFFPMGTTVGYAVGDSGMILKTTDSGASWEAMFSANNKPFRSVFFKNASLGFAVGDGGAIYSYSTGLSDASGPVITDNQPNDDTWRGAESGTYNIDISDSGESHINQLQFRLCSSESNCGDAIDWTVLDTNIGADSITDDWAIPPVIWQSVPEGTSWLSMRVYDGAGNGAEAGPLFSIKKDSTLPDAIAQVKDGFGADIDWSTSTSTLPANWSASADAQSGIARYWYAVGTSPGATDTLAWTSAGSSVMVTITGLSLESGRVYYVSVKAENNAGLFSTATVSDGVLVSSSGAVVELNAGWNFLGGSKINYQMVFIAAPQGLSAFGFSEGKYTNVDIGASLPIPHAQGLWVYSQNDAAFDTSGTDYASSSYQVALSEGWNVFSNPFSTIVPWASGNASMMCGGAAAPLSPIYKYDRLISSYVAVAPDAGNFLVPFSVYCVKATAGCTLTLQK